MSGTYAMDKLIRWHELNEQLTKVKAEEILLRKEIFGEAFPDPTEGSKENKMNLPDGWILQGDYKITRTVDRAVVDTLLRGDNTGPLIDLCFDYKPSLVLKEWKGLGDEDRALLSDAVTEKPGAPALKIILPKR